MSNFSSSPVVKIKVRVGDQELKFRGREAHTVNQLIEHGAAGLSSIEQIGPRLAHHILKARRAGLVIETVEEKHAGAFRGWHGRYVLHSPVEVIERVRAGEMRHAA